jgi:hypothetical protein
MGTVLYLRDHDLSKAYSPITAWFCSVKCKEVRDKKSIRRRAGLGVLRFGFGVLERCNSQPPVRQV